jgi:hypothetical protein
VGRFEAGLGLGEGRLQDLAFIDRGRHGLRRQAQDDAASEPKQDSHAV